MNFSGTSSGASAAAAVAASSHRGISLSNTIHSEVASCLPLPSLPVFCGASDQDFRLSDMPPLLNRVDVLSQSRKIAEMLQHTDVSYLNLRDDAKDVQYVYVEPLELHDEVLRCNPEAFEYSTAGVAADSVTRWATGTMMVNIFYDALWVWVSGLFLTVFLCALILCGVWSVFVMAAVQFFQ